MYYLLRSIELVVNFLPERVALGIGAVIGRLGYILDRRHRKLAISNISRVFGKEKGPAEARAIAKRSFQNLGKNVVEFFRKTPEDFEVQGYRNIEDLLKRNEPAIYILGHFGNWEVLGKIAARHGLKLTAVGRRIKNRGVDKYIKSRRFGSGLEILGKRGAAGGLVKALKNGRSLAILIDQYAGRHGVFVQFFGIPTSTTPSPAVLALRTGAPVVPVFIIRKRGSRHKIFIESPMSITKTGDINEDIYNNTKRFVQCLEKYVRQYPDQWWWVHRRWR